MKDQKEKIKINILEDMKKYSMDIIYIFGSYITGNFRQKSDVDIAYMGDLDFYEKMDLKSTLESEINHDVDLVDLSKIDQNFLAEIILTGKCIYRKDEIFQGNLEMKILSNYLTLEEDRKIVIDAIKKRGAVYGSGSVK